MGGFWPPLEGEGLPPSPCPEGRSGHPAALPTVVAASPWQRDPDWGLLGPSSWVCSASQGSGATSPWAWALSRGSPSALSGLGVGRARPLHPHQPGRAGGSPGPRMSDVIGCPINEQVVAPTCSHLSARRLGAGRGPAAACPRCLNHLLHLRSAGTLRGPGASWGWKP